MTTAAADLCAEVKNTVADQNLLRGVNRCLIAFSAGPDSVCLLDVLDRLYRNRLKFRLVYVNHGLRPAGVLKREEELTRAYARRYGAEFEIVKIRIKKSKLGTEARARELRYRALTEAMKRAGGQRIVLGHNLDDVVETFLLNLARGSGIKGFQSIPAVRMPFMRPLINVKKADILKYLRTRRLRFSIDETNRDIKYRRNLMRHMIVPRLQAVNPRLHEAIKKAIEFLKTDDDYLESRAALVYRRTVRRSGNNLSLDMDKLIRYNKALSYRVIRKAFQEMAGTLDGFESKHFALIFGLMSKENGKLVNLPKGLFAQKDYDRVAIGQSRKTGSFYRKLNIKDDVLIRDSFKVRSRLVMDFDLARRKPGIEVFDRVQVFPPLYIRSPRAGDFILTKIGKKRIKKYYNEYKISFPERNRLLVLGDRKGILWLLGYGRAHRARVGTGTKKFLVVSIEKTD